MAMTCGITLPEMSICKMNFLNGKVMAIDVIKPTKMN